MSGGGDIYPYSFVCIPFASVPVEIWGLLSSEPQQVLPVADPELASLMISDL